MDWITAFCNMVQSGFNFFKARSDNQLPANIIQDKKSMTKACNYAEEIIEIVDKYPKDEWSNKDIRRYNRLKKKFNKAD